MKGISKDFSVGDINDVANFATQLAKYEDDLDSFQFEMLDKVLYLHLH